MSANKWMKWLSVIALIISGGEFILQVYNFEGYGYTLEIFLLSVWAVIASFKKDSSAVTAKKK